MKINISYRLLDQWKKKNALDRNYKSSFYFEKKSVPLREL